MDQHQIVAAAAWQEAGAKAANLADLPWSGGGSSWLAKRIRDYLDALEAHWPGPTLGEALGAVQKERLLRHRLDEQCWPAPGWRVPLDPGPWLEAPGGLDGTQADQLLALVHLLPEAEQIAFAGDVSRALRARLDGSDQRPPGEAGPDWIWLTGETLIGGLNSREPELVRVGEELRRHLLRVARGLEDPVLKVSRLVRSLDARNLEADPSIVDELAAAIDTVVAGIEEASSRGDGRERRLLQRQLADALRGVGGNLELLKALVVRLSAACCSQLPQRQPPSACLLLLKGLLLLDPATVQALPDERLEDLVQLFERLLPRVWWQVGLLRVLLRDLRRFPLDAGWLGRHGGAVLPGAIRLHRYLVPPQESSGAQPGESGLSSPEEADDLARVQLLVLMRLGGGIKDRANLLRRAQELHPGAAQRCWQGRQEGAILEAACAGMGDHTTSLLRLWAQGRGVPELLPLLPRRGGVEAAFDHVLEHWRSRPAWSATSQARPSIAVVITTFRPDLRRLAQALDALRLQTLPASEVLLVDDGSPAEEAEALKHLVALYRHGHGLPLRLLVQDRNRGQYAGRNLAISASRSELLAIQDDDDLSHPLRLERQWEAMRQGALACYARHVRLEEASGQPQPDGDGLQAVGDGITTLMVRRSTAVDLGGFYPVRSRGDVEFRSRLIRAYGESAVAWLGQPLYLMRGAPSTVSSGFEYGCSLRLPTWRRLVREGYLV
jgi:hypothetical protein